MAGAITNTQFIKILTDAYSTKGDSKKLYSPSAKLDQAIFAYSDVEPTAKPAISKPESKPVESDNKSTTPKTFVPKSAKELYDYHERVAGLVLAQQHSGANMQRSGEAVKENGAATKIGEPPKNDEKPKDHFRPIIQSDFSSAR